MGNVVRMIQVLLCREAENAKELGPTLWAALQEAEAFYNHDEQRLNVDRFYIGPGKSDFAKGAAKVFDSQKLGEQWNDLWKKKRKESFLQRGVTEKYLPHNYEMFLNSMLSYPRTYELDHLLTSTMRILGPASTGARVLIVTDQELTPPPKWRYIIWDANERGSIVSTATVDPYYWNESDPNRLLTIKHRARTAFCSITGSALSLKVCHNPRCFLFAPIEATVQLDDMVYLGSEHSLPGLTRRGFLPNKKPTAVQKVGVDPKYKQEAEFA